MKKYLLAGVALAALAGGSASGADLAVGPPPVAPIWSWTGFYVGAHVGGAWGTKEFTNIISDAVSPLGFGTNLDSTLTVNGMLGGAQIGFNYQTGPAVWGVEIQGSGASITGKGACQNGAFLPLTITENCRARIDALATFAARIGFTAERTMVYVKGGGALAHDRYDLDFIGATIPLVTAPSSVSDPRWGWMFGAGVEYAFAGPWSAKVEYNYMDFGTKGYTFNTLVTIPPGLFDQFDVQQRIHLIKFGVNYRFAGWAF